MLTNRKKLTFLTVVTIFAGLNLLTAGIAYGQQSQGVSVVIQSGDMTPVFPDSITFQRTILDGTHPVNLTAVLDPNDGNQTVQVQDPWCGQPFRIDISVKNLTNATGEILPYSLFKFITLHDNTRGNPIDINPVTPQVGTNNVTSDPAVTYYYDAQSSNPGNFADNLFTVFPADPGDANPDDVNSISQPFTIMQRNAPTSSMGIYSVGLAFRANIPQGTIGGEYEGEVIFDWYHDPCP